MHETHGGQTELWTAQRSDVDARIYLQKRVLPFIAAPVMHPAPIYFGVTLDDRRDTLGSKWERTSSPDVSFDVNRLAIRAFLDVDDSCLRLAGSHMARFSSWCEREEEHVCWKAVWKASTVILAACSSGRNVGLSRSFRSLILPEGQGAQRFSALWHEWISQLLSVLC